ncbi:hypothetical protein RHMOL_Rhmol03G0171500 [Rhododendron molle]|uniref:Uncharacterized protein n=1 Tax=Rhododendron molle TaxID=49168 RepID=A0ACC0PF36_RHOML|nr:hypothetical protein RHMOL_Rhmol03G0171500 [Rhododendron molle]
METGLQGFHEDTSFLSTLPKTKWKLGGDMTILQWKGFWLLPDVVNSVISIENQFNPIPSDILLVSFPKTGTTWLKALTTTILGHSSYPKSHSRTDPLQTRNPHELIPFLELETFGENPPRDINQFPSPRVFSTHFPYSALPESIKNSGCRIIYLSQNPADTFVSGWHFYKRMFGSDIPLEEAFDDFCKGTVPRGPFVDHVLEYWLQREKENVLFVRYEELTEDPNVHVRRIAEFLGCSLSGDEVDQVVWKCSYARLSKLGVNNGEEERVNFSGMKLSSFFRSGVVGDGKKLLSPEMVERIETLAKQKWEGSGLKLKMFVADRAKFREIIG